MYLPPCGEICSKLSIHCTSTQQRLQEIIYYRSLLDPAHKCPIISLLWDSDWVWFGAFGRLRWWAPFSLKVWNCLFPVANKSHWEKKHNPTGCKVNKAVNNEHCPFGFNPMDASSRHKNKANKSPSICIFIPDYYFAPMTVKYARRIYSLPSDAFGNCDNLTLADQNLEETWTQHNHLSTCVTYLMRLEGEQTP